MPIKKLNTDRIVAVSAMIISILTLIIFIYQTNIMHRQSKLSVKPRLSFETNYDNFDSLVQIQIDILNKGLGPAIIDSIYFVHGQMHYPLHTGPFFEAKLPKMLEYGEILQSSSLEGGDTITPEDETSIFTYVAPKSKIDSVTRYLNSAPNFSIEVIYTSIYEDQRWKVDMSGGVPEEVR